MSAHQGSSYKRSKRMRDSLIRNYRALDGKQALLATWEQVKPDDDYVSELKHRVRITKVRLQNRGMMVDT